MSESVRYQQEIFVADLARCYARLSRSGNFAAFSIPSTKISFVLCRAREDVPSLSQTSDSTRHLSLSEQSQSHIWLRAPLSKLYAYHDTTRTDCKQTALARHGRRRHALHAIGVAGVRLVVDGAWRRAGQCVRSAWPDIRSHTSRIRGARVAIGCANAAPVLLVAEQHDLREGNAVRAGNDQLTGATLCQHHSSKARAGCTRRSASGGICHGTCGFVLIWQPDAGRLASTSG